jgi:AAA domain-containing protein
MRRVLVTGVSAVGKSTAVRELARRGVKAVDLDDPTWSEWVDSPDGDGPSPLHPGQDWLWREDRVARLLATEDADTLVVGGCAPNLGTFRDRFDVIVLLSAPAAVMASRLGSRAGSAYGTHPEELARSLRFKETVEPRLRSIAHAEIDTTAPLDDVVGTLLALARTAGKPTLAR